MRRVPARGIEFENDMLTVRGERRPPWEDLDGCTGRIERSFGAFERTLRVTDSLDPDAIEAQDSPGESAPAGGLEDRI